MKELVTIQAALKAPKNQVNKFGGYKYRSAEDIMEAVKPHLKDVGCVLILTDGIIEVGGRVYVQATAKLINKEGAVIEAQAYAREEETKKGMDASQITGSASSYARKYALNGLFCIDDTKDADATNTHGKDAQEEELNLDRIIEQVNTYTTYEQLQAIWDSFKKFDKDKKLASAIAARRKQIGV